MCPSTRDYGYPNLSSTASSSRPTLYIWDSVSTGTDANGYYLESKTVNGGQASDKNPTVPAGFKPYENDSTADAHWTDSNGAPSEKSIKNGLVIQGKDGSEFVWVPVPNINNMVMCKKNAGNPVCSLQLDDGQLVCKTHSDSTDLCGRLYMDGGALDYSGTYTEKDQTYMVGGGEPSVATADSSYLENVGLNDITEFQTQMQEDFNKMAVSVAKYGGFYIGRCELSFVGASSSVSPSSGIGQCRRRVYAATEDKSGTYMWYGFYKKERDYASDIGVSSAVGSSMVWGCQYDAMMKWMYDNGVELQGDTYRGGNTEDRTGITETDKLCNVYDLMGCHFECTLEAWNTNTRVIRGGNRWETNCASVRKGQEPWSTLLNSGSRPTLYIN